MASRTEPHGQLPEEEKLGILTRLRRIEGQVKGLQRMVREDRDCGEITQQLAAARAALDNVAIGLLTAWFEHCLEANSGGMQEAKDALRKLHQSMLVLR